MNFYCTMNSPNLEKYTMNQIQVRSVFNYLENSWIRKLECILLCAVIYFLLNTSLGWKRLRKDFTEICGESHTKRGCLPRPLSWSLRIPKPSILTGCPWSRWWAPLFSPLPEVRTFPGRTLAPVFLRKGKTLHQLWEMARENLSPPTVILCYPLLHRGYIIHYFKHAWYKCCLITF